MDNRRDPIVERLGSARRLLDIDTRQTMLPPPPSADDPGWDHSWAYLFETYTPAMRRYVTTLLAGLVGREAAKTEAEDVVQGYLAACVEKGWLARDAREMTSFRSWLKMQLFRFTCDWMDRMNAKKRKAPGFEDPEVLRGLRSRVLGPADAAFDEALVVAATERAVEKLAQRSEDQAEIIRELLRRAGDAGNDLGPRLGKSPPQLAALKRRARVSFAALLAEELRATVRDLSSFDTLLRELDPLLP